MICEREETNDGWWTCHRCGSLWSDMLAGTGWLPLACPHRKSPDYNPQPGQIDHIVLGAKS
jgi:hypothetical protein